MSLSLTDYDFVLPTSLIAKKPESVRSASKLMGVFNHQHSFTHRHFYNIIDFIQPGDLLIFNDTKVIPARLFGHKTTGGQVEVLIERVLDTQRALVQMKVSKPPRVGDALIFANDIHLLVGSRSKNFYELSTAQGNILEIIEKIGQVPLPHYMARSVCAEDKERYQTVYAKHKGSVAAPTAGLHFDQALLDQLREKKVEMAYLTLHIGAGTFAPIRVNHIVEHQMHAEYFTVSKEACDKINAAKLHGKRIIAVGTTTLRTLETVYQHLAQHEILQPSAGETNIFIYPGFQFRCVDVLITNFHLPRSSLFILVCAFAGRQTMMQAYQEAISHSYRFYSYGDAMWIERLTREGKSL